MFVSVREVSDQGEAWESRRGLIGLQPLDLCDVGSIDRIEEAAAALPRTRAVLVKVIIGNSSRTVSVAIVCNLAGSSPFGRPPADSRDQKLRTTPVTLPSARNAPGSTGVRNLHAARAR